MSKIVNYYFSMIEGKKSSLVSRPAFVVSGIVDSADGKLADLQVVVNPRFDRKPMGLGYATNPGLAFREKVPYSEEPKAQCWSNK